MTMAHPEPFASLVRRLSEAQGFTAPPGAPDGSIIPPISDSRRANPCTCGHDAVRHEEEMPYPCYDCGCGAFTIPDPPRDLGADRDLEARERQAELEEREP
jgi:hypothetical protein